MRIVVKKMELVSGKWELIGSTEWESLEALAHIAKSFGENGAKIAKCYEVGAINGRELIYELETHLSHSLQSNQLAQLVYIDLVD